MKMSSRADGRAQSLVLAWLVELGAGTVGFLAARPVVAAVGLGADAVGVLGSGRARPGDRVKQLRWAGPRLAQLGAGVAWWVGATLAVVCGTRATGVRVHSDRGRRARRRRLRGGQQYVMSG